MDPGHGQLREPLLKVLHVLRSLEFKLDAGKTLNLRNMHTRVGQMAHFSPGVFNFYLPEFIPAGSLEDAGLVSPESQIFTSPYLIGYLNGMSSLIDHGLTDCGNGFGNTYARKSVAGQVDGGCSETVKAQWAKSSDGVLQFKPTHPSNPEKVAAELALVVTGGRLSAQTKATLVNAYANYLSETPLNITDMRRVEEAKLGSRQPAPRGECRFIKSKQDCCGFYDSRTKNNGNRLYYADGPNCIPGDYADGNVCLAEQQAGYRNGDKMEMCGKVPLPAMSRVGDSGALKAIDGKFGSPFLAGNHPDSGALISHHAGVCVQSSRADNPWWQVDLGVKQDISSISLYERVDGQFHRENRNFTVYLDGKPCAEQMASQSGDYHRIPCRGYAQVIKVVLVRARASFSFCEIQVNVNQAADKDGGYPSNPVAEARALKHLLKLFIMAPEFHTTNRHVATPTVRPVATGAKPTGRQYKAVVVLFLEGGADSFNIVIPHSGCKKPPAAEDDPTLAPRMLKGGEMCAKTTSCQTISSAAWCKTHAGLLKVAYRSYAASESSSSRPPGCYVDTGTSVLRFNNFKESIAVRTIYEPLCLCGKYEDLGIGMCRDGYYAGSSTPGATLDSCRTLCDNEDTCKFFSLEKDTCKRYSGDINSCTPLDGFTHRTYKKLKLAASSVYLDLCCAPYVVHGGKCIDLVSLAVHSFQAGTRRARNARADLPLVEHDFYAEYAAIRGAEDAIPKKDLHELKMPTGSKQPCASFGRSITHSTTALLIILMWCQTSRFGMYSALKHKRKHQRCWVQNTFRMPPPQKNTHPHIK